MLRTAVTGIEAVYMQQDIAMSKRNWYVGIEKKREVDELRRYGNKAKRNWRAVRAPTDTMHKNVLPINNGGLPDGGGTKCANATVYEWRDADRRWCSRHPHENGCMMAVAAAMRNDVRVGKKDLAIKEKRRKCRGQGIVAGENESTEVAVKPFKVRRAITAPMVRTMHLQSAVDGCMRPLKRKPAQATAARAITQRQSGGGRNQMKRTYCAHEWLAAVIVVSPRILRGRTKKIRQTTMKKRPGDGDIGEKRERFGVERWTRPNAKGDVVTRYYKSRARPEWKARKSPPGNLGSSMGIRDGLFTLICCHFSWLLSIL
ncbi:hypothetical protein C8J57DRAFT_1211284 [Mycena rebaudengoi]|nr:hypothetical protein C8J57DRAFT_1211284 [Mycena rebaudengoi]